MNGDNGEKPNADSKNEKNPLKTCQKCHLPKLLTEFTKNKKAVDGHQAWCKPCRYQAAQTPERKQYERDYRISNAKAIEVKRSAYLVKHKIRDAKRDRVYHYKTYFNLTVEEVQKVVDYQDGRCAMCGRTLLKPNVDHRHSDGLIRGALCWPCNRLLGLAHDNPDRLRQGISYLEDPPATRALGGARYGLPGRVGTKKQRKLAKKLKKSMLDLSTST